MTPSLLLPPDQDASLSLRRMSSAHFETPVPADRIDAAGNSPSPPPPTTPRAAASTFDSSGDYLNPGSVASQNASAHLNFGDIVDLTMVDEIQHSELRP